ncbi:MAG: hypothetical protein Q8L21_02300 [Candidatus Komeilibacteria bacterium]|nr:hypothetical protein [Candidatus Komeilibacteria bacterium]
MRKEEAKKLVEDLAAAQKNFDAAYARLRRFIDKQKLGALQKNLKSGVSKQK